MTTTPNTAAELIALNNQEPVNPYTRAQVEAAMQALAPENGGNLGDLQAVAEICLDILINCATQHVEEYKTEDPEFAQGVAEDLCRLKVANDMLEGCAYIHMNDDDDA